MDIRVSEKDRQDFNSMLTGLNTSMDYVRRPIPVETPLDKVRAYYDKVMETFKSFKVKEHMLRCQFAEEYNVPYNFSYNDGIIPIDDGLTTDTTANELEKLYTDLG